MNSGSVMNDSRRSLTFSLYILYILAIFTAGLLAVVALVINYVKQDQMRGSIYESHFTWQIRTFWWYLIWNIVAFIPFIFCCLQIIMPMLLPQFCYLPQVFV